MDQAAQTALRYAKAGWYVFPVQPKKQVPHAGYHWREESTNDPAKVQAETARFPGCNWAIDCGKSGVFVVDVDIKPEKGVDGRKTLLQLPELDSSFVVQTPSGGFHYYMTGEGPNSASTFLGDGLDTRGVGGYVLIPGSFTDKRGGYYRFLTEPTTLPKPIPEWLKAKFGSIPEKKKDREKPLVELDLDPNVAIATSYLVNQAQQALEGSGGNHATFQVACRVRDFGVSEETALELMLNHWNDTKAVPSWGPDELQHVIKNAYNYSRDRAGNASAVGMFEADQAAAAAQFSGPLSTATIRCASDLDLSKMKPLEWILGHRYSPGYVTLTVAPGGTGKSFLTILEAMSIASGEQLTYDEVKQQGAVWMYNTEDPMDELDRRIVAASMNTGIPTKGLPLYYSSGYETPLNLVSYAPGGQTAVINQALVDGVVQGLKDRNIKLFIVDPFVRCHSVSENDNGAMDLVVRAFQMIAKEANCAIGLVHHVTKGGSNGATGNADKVRGASSLVSACRIAHTFYHMTEKEALEFGIQPERAPWYVRLDSAKSNLAPPSTQTRWFELQSEYLFPESPESTGTIRKVSLDAVETVSGTEHIINGVVGALVKATEPVSVYSVAKILSARGVPGSMSKIRRQIEDCLMFPAEMFGWEYKIESVAGRAGKETKFVVKTKLEK